MRLLPLLVVLMMSLGLASAGTVDEPEITDPADDYRLTGGQADPNNLVKSVDLIKAWVQETTDAHVELRVQAGQQMRGGQVNGNPTTEYDYDFHFTSMGGTYTAAATIKGPAPPSVTARGVASEASIDPASDSTLILIVPLESIGQPGPGDAITAMYVASRVYGGSSTVGTDRAPNSGFGTDYILPGALAVEGNVTQVNVTTPALQINQTFSAWHNGTTLYNWTGPANVTMDLVANGTGIANVTIADPAGVVQFACVCNNLTQTTDFMAINGTWTINVTYEAFNGTFALHMGETSHGMDDGHDHDDHDHDGNITVEEPAGEDSPTPWVVPVLAIGLAFMARRRHA